MSHWASYVGAAVGEAVPSVFPAPYKILGDCVGTAVSNLVSSVSYNIESTILNRDEYYCFEEVFYTTYNDVALIVLSNIGYGESKVGQIISSSKLKEGAKDMFRGGIIAFFDGIRGFVSSKWPDSSNWKSPEPERWYPGR